MRLTIPSATKRCSKNRHQQAIVSAWWVARGRTTRRNVGLQAVGGGGHRRAAFVGGVNDLGVVDPAEVHRGDREVGMPELPLDDKRTALLRATSRPRAHV